MWAPSLPATEWSWCTLHIISSWSKLWWLWILWFCWYWWQWSCSWWQWWWGEPSRRGTWTSQELFAVFASSSGTAWPTALLRIIWSLSSSDPLIINDSSFDHLINFQYLIEHSIQSMYKRHKSSPEDHLIIIAHRSFYHLLIIIIRSSFDHYQDIIWSLAGHRYYLVIAIRAFFHLSLSPDVSLSLHFTPLAVTQLLWN